MAEPRTVIPLSGYSTVIWATGFRPHFPFLEPHLLDRRGAIIHDGGVMAEHGMYVLGQPFLRRRRSSFLEGVGVDAADLSGHLAWHVAGKRSSGSWRSVGGARRPRAGRPGQLAGRRQGWLERSMPGSMATRRSSPA